MQLHISSGLEKIWFVIATNFCLPLAILHYEMKSRLLFLLSLQPSEVLKLKESLKPWPKKKRKSGKLKSLREEHFSFLSLSPRCWIVVQQQATQGWLTFSLDTELHLSPSPSNTHFYLQFLLQPVLAVLSAASEHTQKWFAYRGLCVYHHLCAILYACLLSFSPFLMLTF